MSEEQGRWAATLSNVSQHSVGGALGVVSSILGVIAAFPICFFLAGLKDTHDHPHPNFAPWADIDFGFAAALVFFVAPAIVAVVALGFGISGLVYDRPRFIAIFGTALSSALLLAALVLGVMWWD